VFDIQVPLGDLDPAAPDLIDQIVARFHRRHEELYTYSAPGQDVVLVNARVAVVGVLPTLPSEPALEANGPAVAQRTRRIHLGGWLDAPVHDLDALRPGHEVKGPALFESATTTVLVREGERASATPNGWLDIRLV